MTKFSVGGMTCAACSARVEKAVSALAGVDTCSVNLLTNSMQVQGSASNEEIIKAVEKAGYTATIWGDSPKKESPKDDGSKSLFKRLMYSFSDGNVPLKMTQAS